jgi:hypothetical protein
MVIPPRSHQVPDDDATHLLRRSIILAGSKVPTAPVRWIETDSDLRFSATPDIDSLTQEGLTLSGVILSYEAIEMLGGMVMRASTLHAAGGSEAIRTLRTRRMPESFAFAHGNGSGLLFSRASSPVRVFRHERDLSNSLFERAIDDRAPSPALLLLITSR